MQQVVFDDGRLLAIKEVAAILCISRDAVRRLILKGKLAAVVFPQMGGKGRNVKRMVSEKELRRFMDAAVTLRKLERFIA